MASNASSGSGSESFLLVRCGGQVCALPAGAVIEVLRPPQLEGSADGTRALLGFARLRGELSAVFELAVLLGLEPAREDAGQRRAVRLRLGPRSAAVLVDAVRGVETAAPERMTAIALPGGAERQLGRFDEEFARVIALGGLLPEPLPEPPAAAGSASAESGAEA